VKLITTLLLALSFAITSSCSKSGSDSQRGDSKQETFSENQVGEIVDAVNAKDVAKVTALLQANPKLVRAKFTSGGPVDGWPLLMIAAKEGDKPMAELLLRSGADVNAENNSSEVALHYAALHGHKEMVQLLIDHGANVNVKNDAAATPLAAATSAGKTDIVALLKQHGAKE
jgi:ankyrin repeat protein